MAYFSGFPASYQPMYPQIQPVPQQAPQNGIIWVQGEAAAKSYLIAPNSTVQLWDSEEKVIYLKSADPSGLPSMKILDYTIRGEEIQGPEYATKDDLKALEEKIQDLRSKVGRANRKDDDDE